MVNDNVLLYRLYYASSVDGRGYPVYTKGTTDKEVALKHLKLIASSPYCIGHVVVTYESKEFFLSTEHQLLSHKYGN